MNTSYYENRIQNRASHWLIIISMNLLLGLVIFLWTFVGLFLFPFAFGVMRLGKGRNTAWITRWCIWVYGRVWQFFTRLFVTFETINYHPSRFETPGIIVVNHRSFFDTYCMNMLPEFNICFAVRDWPFGIPIYNIFMRMAGYLNIEKYDWEKSLTRSRQTLAEKGFILFFPEGHRSKTHEMTRFFSGAFKLAVETNTPIIPICLTGTEDLLPPDRPYMAPARIRLQVLHPVFPSQIQGEPKHLALKKRVKQIMAEHLAAMDEKKSHYQV
ncbi:MAG: 1-acyl-sn-glycerol-3-phosphate acyltransferase [Desulfobacteraceae bacterium]|nr:1-acyl-sn-glycerol-3-phosphate acyltransferase [Desulfobacteraceae bacterium]